MPQNSHQRAAEMHDLAAHAHRVAAAHQGKEDHQTGPEIPDKRWNTRQMLFGDRKKLTNNPVGPQSLRTRGILDLT